MNNANDFEKFAENAKLIANLAIKIDSFEKLGQFVSVGFLATTIELFNAVSKATGSKDRAVIVFTGFSPLAPSLPFDIIFEKEKEENKKF